MEKDTSNIRIMQVWKAILSGFLFAWLGFFCVWFVCVSSYLVLVLCFLFGFGFCSCVFYRGLKQYNISLDSLEKLSLTCIEEKIKLTVE